MDEDQTPLLRSTSSISQINRSDTRRCQTRYAIIAVLLSETLERIAFYGLVGSLVIFLNGTPYNWSSYNASNALFIFTGFSYMSSLLGGWIADSWIGKYRTIIIFLFLYIAGFMLFPLLYPYPYIHPDITNVPKWCSPVNLKSTSNITLNAKSPLKLEDGIVTTLGQLYASMTANSTVFAWASLSPAKFSKESCSTLVYVALAIVAVGNGAFKANISPFGAEQVKHEGPESIRTFVNWFYWCINFGALVSFGGLAYIQQEISFFWGFIPPLACLIITLIIFTIGGFVYKTEPAGGSVLTNVVKIICQSGCKACLRRKRPTYGLVSSAPEAFQAAPIYWLDYAKIQHGGNYHNNMVDDVKKLAKICVIFLAMIPYWIVYFQMETTFVMQGLYMRLDPHGDGTKEAAKASKFTFPLAWLSLFDVVFLIFLLPLFDRVIYPALDRRGYIMTPRLRIVLGMAFSMLSVAVAGLLELCRMQIYWRDDQENPYWQFIGGTYYRAANITILAQIPQYALIGISEVFASVAGLEIAYVLAPHTMQGLVTGLYWFTQGVGSILGSVILQAFRGIWLFSWSHGDINCRHLPCPTADDPHAECNCHLDYYFFFLAGLQFIAILLFSLIAWKMDLGLQSAYSRSTSRMDDSLSPLEQSANDFENSSGMGISSGTSRQGYRSFARRNDRSSDDWYN